jgi:hypothetical protein
MIEPAFGAAVVVWRRTEAGIEWLHDAFRWLRWRKRVRSAYPRTSASSSSASRR